MTAFSEIGLTIGGLCALVGAIVGIAKALDWLDTRGRKRVDDATTALSAKIGVIEIRADQTSRELAEFKLEAARSYVTHDAQRRLEDRIDSGFDAVRDEIGNLRDTLIGAIADRAPAKRRPTV